MDVRGIHEKLKIILSPKDYVELLTLMIKDVEEMIEWGEKQKDNSGEGNDENLYEPDRPRTPCNDPGHMGLFKHMAGADQLPHQRGEEESQDSGHPPTPHQRQHRKET